METNNSNKCMSQLGIRDESPSKKKYIKKEGLGSRMNSYCLLGCGNILV